MNSQILHKHLNIVKLQSSVVVVAVVAVVVTVVAANNVDV